MPRKKPNPDIVALKRAVKAIQSCSSERAARATINYLYDAFIANPAEETRQYWRNREDAQHQSSSSENKSS